MDAEVTVKPPEFHEAVGQFERPFANFRLVDVESSAIS